MCKNGIILPSPMKSVPSRSAGVRVKVAEKKADKKAEKRALRQKRFWQSLA